jgi:hypothetical protein
MMMKLCFALTGLFFAIQSYATPVIDVYGMTPAEATKLLKTYAKQLDEFTRPFEGDLSSMFDEKNAAEMEKISVKKRALIREMKKKEHLLYADITLVFYPGEEQRYFTIDVVKNGDKKRLRFVDNEKPSTSYSKTNDIVDKMDDYVQQNARLMLENKTDGKTMHCPVYHCINDFSHPEAKPYLSLFNQAIVKQKALILETLSHDPNPNRRASAAFLIGHMHDPHEIIMTLLPYVDDPSSAVRNNVIRVIAVTMQKAQINDVDPTPFLALLQSPYDTDRNKSLYVLSHIADSKEKHNILIQHGASLVALLQLKQPNNHEPAYSVLRKLTTKPFGEYDIVAWKRWLNDTQKG